jgi:RNA polymerase sigma-70 factor (ECF subfamily)
MDSPSPEEYTTSRFCWDPTKSSQQRLLSGMTTHAALPDTALIESALAGKTESFEILMHRHCAAVRSHVRAMTRNPWDADDLVQETFFKAWRGLASFRAEASFRTWITRVATNEVLQHRRRQFRVAVEVATPDLETHASNGGSPHDVTAQAERRRAVHRAVAALPPKYRTVLVMCDLREMELREAAARLSAGIPFVKSRLMRARQRLRAAACLRG